MLSGVVDRSSKMCPKRLSEWSGKSFVRVVWPTACWKHLHGLVRWRLCVCSVTFFALVLHFRSTCVYLIDTTRVSMKLQDSYIVIFSELKSWNSTFEPLRKGKGRRGTRWSSGLQLLWMSQLRPPPSRHPWQQLSSTATFVLPVLLRSRPTL